jgi:hypothetical protein
MKFHTLLFCCLFKEIACAKNYGTMRFCPYNNITFYQRMSKKVFYQCKIYVKIINWVLIKSYEIVKMFSGGYL